MHSSCNTYRHAKKRKKPGGYAGRYFLQVLWCVMTFWGITFVYWQTLNTVQIQCKAKMCLCPMIYLFCHLLHMGFYSQLQLHFSVSVSPSPLLIATAHSFTCPLPEDMSTINNSLQVTTEHPVQLTKTLMCWYMVQGWKSVIYRMDGVLAQQLSWCLGKLSSVVCIVWYVIVLTCHVFVTGACRQLWG